MNRNIFLKYIPVTHHVNLLIHTTKCKTGGTDKHAGYQKGVTA